MGRSLLSHTPTKVGRLEPASEPSTLVVGGSFASTQPVNVPEPG